MLNFPDLLQLDWNDKNLFDTCYQIYENQIYNNLPNFLGLPIYCSILPKFQNRHDCFWHITTSKNKDDGNRYPDKSRMCRLHWIPFIIQNSMSPDILCWEKEEQTPKGLRPRTYLWAKQEKFAVILEKQKTCNRYRLVTAYLTNFTGTLNKFKKESKKYPDPRKNAGS